MRQTERIPDLLKTQTHCRGHSEQDAYVCCSMAKIPQGTAPTVLALFKQHGPKAKKCKTYQVCFLFCLYFYPFSPLNSIPHPNPGTPNSNALPQPFALIL